MNHNYHSSSCLWLYDRETVREIDQSYYLWACSSLPSAISSSHRLIVSGTLNILIKLSTAAANYMFTCSKLQQLSNNAGKWSMKVLLTYLLRLMATSGNAYTHTFTHIRHFPSGGLPKVIRKTSDIGKVELLQVSCPWWCTTNWRVSIVS